MPAAHPRSRGEHFGLGSCKTSFAGSSPLARGTPVTGGVRSSSKRLIPARAGNTVRNCSGAAKSTAHPRSRGEHTKDAIDAISSARLIPARAGNTDLSCHAHFMCPAHPRSRGEHFLAGVIATSSTGSSPLARGTRKVSDFLSLFFRLIPARAGNTM